MMLRISASASAITGVTTGATRIAKAWLVGGSAASTALVYDAATQSGTDVLGLAAPIGTTSPQVELDSDADCGGLLLKNGLSVTLTGTGAVLYLIVT